MITIDGAFGNGTVWVAWKPSRANAPQCAIPTGVTAYVGFSPPWSPVIPCSFFLPPATGEILYHTGYTPYGARVGHIEVGTIISHLGDHHYPLPCLHSTVTGTLTPLGADGTQYASHRVSSGYSLVNGPYYRSDDSILQFLSGRSASTNDKRVYNHLGELVKMPIVTSTRFYWNDNVSYLMSHIPFNAPSIPQPEYHSELGQWIFSINPRSSASTKPKRARKSEWTHVSDNVWREDYMECYHNNASYTPEKPYSFAGLPYTIAQVHIVRTYTLQYLRQNPKGVFSGYFDITEDIEWYHKAPLHPAQSGKASLTYANVSYLEVLQPGLTTACNAPLTALDDYCRHAANRAVHLYDEKQMGIARSVAIADVSALESNWLENFSQMGGYSEVFDPLIAGYQCAMNNDARGAVKALAGAYLVYKYCIAPTVADKSDLSNNLEKQVHNSLNPVFSNERRRGNHIFELPLDNRNSILGYFCTYHMSLKDNSFSTVLAALERLGLDPSASHGWDFVPFSFVLDWFISIGPALAKISAYNNARLTRELKARVQTFKVVWPLNTTEIMRYIPYNWKVNGPLLYSWYDRRVAKRWGTFDPFAGQKNDGLSWSQMAQGSALLISILL